MLSPIGALPQSLLRYALHRWGSAAAGAMLLTGLTHVLGLTGCFYLFAIYDCVLPAQSVPLLISVSLGAAGLHMIHGVLDAFRSRLLNRGAGAFHAVLRDDIFAAIQLVPLRLHHIRDPLRPVRDIDQVRAFLSSAGAVALLDLPWVPAYLVVLYLLNPALGLYALGGAIVIGSLALIAQGRIAGANLEACKRSALRLDFCESIMRNAKAARPADLNRDIESRWRAIWDAHAAHHQIALDVAGLFAGLFKAARLIVQSGILVIGAYLLMRNEISVGIMMAASILMTRALAPIEATSAHWRSLAAARQSYRRLSALLEALRCDRCSNI